MIQHHRKKSTGHSPWHQNIPSLLFCKRGKGYHGPQAHGGHIQERCSNTIKETTVHLTEGTPIQIKIIYKPELGMYSIDWLSRQNHKEDQEKAYLQVNINVINIATDIPMSIIIRDTWEAKIYSNHLRPENIYFWWMANNRADIKHMTLLDIHR